MIKLKKVKVFKYKSIQKPQTVEIDPAITTIVGMNESGKTSFLTAIAKTNYFINDKDFEFDITDDYPRNELIDFELSEDDSEIIECEYELSSTLLSMIEEDIGEGVFSVNRFTYTCNYKSNNSFNGVKANQREYLIKLVGSFSLSSETADVIKKCSSLIDASKVEGNDNDEELLELQNEIKRILDGSYPNWNNPLEGYIAKTWIKPKMPKFWYFDDYYPLPGKININQLNNQSNNSESEKTSRALFELARIKPEEIINSNESDYEKYVARLEASSNKITNEIFKYWSTNKNLDFDFKIQEVLNANGQREKLLDIRVKSQRHKISLPLDRRSKGFNWFFSFIIWFSKIQADKNSNYVLLLDEPGLNLHASAQEDLLRFIEDLSDKYQIIYTTHSPFMVDSSHLNRVRTCLETDEGTVISETIQEKDPKTLFPLQAALGYDIAQNLFVSKNNLLVEGPADLIYITIVSNILEMEKRAFLSENITIVPVGGLDKVSTFISLLRGSKLNVVCLLDTFTDSAGKQKVDDLIHHKIIKEKNIRFFDEFSNTGKKTADIEDMFSKEEYLYIFNAAFEGDYEKIEVKDLDPSLDTIIKQINKAIEKKRFNHYRPANKLNQMSVGKSFFSDATLNNFEKMFKEINKLFT